MRPEMPEIHNKAWGQEQWIANNNRYCGKRMVILKGHYCSYHMHPRKTETFFVERGELELIYDGEYVRVGEGSSLYIPSKKYHSFRALKDTLFFEFSTPHSNDDVKRLTESSRGTNEKWKKDIFGAIEDEQTKD